MRQLSKTFESMFFANDVRNQDHEKRLEIESNLKVYKNEIMALELFSQKTSHRIYHHLSKNVQDIDVDK